MSTVIGPTAGPWMNVPSSTPAPAATAGTASTAAQPGGEMGKDQFLQLLVTQLKNQDPLSPSDPSQMASQLAQFSQLEQLVNINSALGTQQTTTAGMVTGLNSAAAANVLGKTVLATGNEIVVGSDGTGHVQFDVGGSGGDATLHVFDSAGREVVTEPLGSVTAGSQNADFKLPGGLAAGDYTYSVDGKDPSGNALSVTTYETGVVNGIRYTASGPVLIAGDMQINLGDVVEITSN